MAEFTQIGFFIDYRVDGKYIGSLAVDAADRTLYGYYGRKTEVTTELITLSNKKKIKPGTTVVTELFPMNGRLKEEFKALPNEKSKN